MIKVSIIGSGNVAQHLIAALSKSPLTEVVQVFSRNSADVGNRIQSNRIVSDYKAMLEADLYIIAVSDSAVAEVSKALPFSGRLVAHTAGSLPLDILDKKNHRASFYPLQTFSKNKELDFSLVPVCIETERPEDLEILDQTASAISNHIYKIDTPQRQALHTAAVFVNNFANHMFAIGAKICDEHGIPFEILKPLIRETADKVMVMQPENAQTGPAIRHDKITIASHLSQLKDENIRNIYNTITNSIISWR